MYTNSVEDTKQGLIFYPIHILYPFFYFTELQFPNAVQRCKTNWTRIKFPQNHIRNLDSLQNLFPNKEFEQRGKMATWPSFKNGFTKVSRDLITLIWKNVYNFNDWSIDAMGIIMLEKVFICRKSYFNVLNQYCSGMSNLVA